MSQIELDNVYKAYYTSRRKNDARIVLDDVSLSIDDGEFVALIGPSGCGKTTILNLIAGFEGPTKGIVRFNGKEISSPSPERGVVFQEYSLLPWLSVRGNIELALECGKVPESERKAIVDDALEAVGMSQFDDYRPNTLSGGMKQRVAIARVLAMDSDILLMDEPFSALDEQSRRKLDNDLVELWKAKKKTVLFVTHNIDEAIQVSTRIVLLSSSPGKVVGEWNLTGMMKSPSSQEYARIKGEIMDKMQVCSCTGKCR